MKNIFKQLFQKTKKAETTAKQQTEPIAENQVENLIKMKEAMALIKASAPTVRKYARLGYYKEYRFGEKLVFYNKLEMLEFLVKGGNNEKK